MQNENIKPTEAAAVAVSSNSSISEDTSVTGNYTVTCTAADGTIRWQDTFKNLVVNVGKTDLLNKYFAGTSYTAAWYLGLVDGASSPTYNAADTMASHSGWTEMLATLNRLVLLLLLAPLALLGVGLALLVLALFLPLLQHLLLMLQEFLRVRS